MAKKGEVTPEVTRQKQSVAQKGKKLSIEHRLKLSKAHTGIKVNRQCPEETRVREEAAATGNIYYFYARLCPRGHISKRYVKDSYCHECIKISKKANKRNRTKTDLGYSLYERVRTKVKQENIPFSLTLKDIKHVWPVDGKCPILGLELRTGNKRPINESPTLDKIVPKLGYIEGNIAVISHKANRIKNDETDPVVFETLANWMARTNTRVPSYFTNLDVKALKQLLASAKKRAKRLNVTFDLKIEDIQAAWPIDNCCPVFSFPFQAGVGSAIPTSATLDRLIPELGYVRSNIAVISHRANTLKNNASNPSELLKVAEWLREKLL